MKKYRPQLFFGAAVVIGLITSLLVMGWLRDAEMRRGAEAALPVVSTAEVVVAKADLAWGTKLTPEMMQVVNYPAGALPDGYYKTVEDLQDAVLLLDVKTNEPILKSKLASGKDVGVGVAAVTDPTKRAMSVKVDEVIGVSGFIKPGDHVDVMVTIEADARRQHPVAKLILENLKVLAAGMQYEKNGSEKDPKPVQVMTLEVDIDEAEKLALASTQGKLRLALRNPLNAEKVLTKGANVGSLMASLRPKEAKRQAAPEFHVEVIKGADRKQMKF
ncbi:Flp pilus assembly protein CpaB [Petrachloros mirabilis]